MTHRPMITLPFRGRRSGGLRPPGPSAHIPAPSAQSFLAPSDEGAVTALRAVTEGEKPFGALPRERLHTDPNAALRRFFMHFLPAGVLSRFSGAGS